MCIAPRGRRRRRRYLDAESNRDMHHQVSLRDTGGGIAASYSREPISNLLDSLSLSFFFRYVTIFMHAGLLICISCLHLWNESNKRYKGRDGHVTVKCAKVSLSSPSLLNSIPILYSNHWRHSSITFNFYKITFNDRVCAWISRFLLTRLYHFLTVA